MKAFNGYENLFRLYLIENFLIKYNRFQVGVYGIDENSTAVWKCAGTLISPNIVVAAENCTGNKHIGYQL